jgi:uncharacterized protein with GYD domain
MPLFITTGNYTEKAMKGMIANPEDRAGPLGKMLEAAACKLHAYYVTSGDSDFLVVAEGPDMETMAAVLMTAGATGGVSNLSTRMAMTSADAVASMKRAARLAEGFRPAGG